MKKETGTVKKIFAVCLLVFLATFGMICVFRYVNNNFFKGDEKVPSDTAVVTSFAELYPFESDKDENEDVNNNLPLLSRYTGLIKWFTDSTNSYLTDINPLEKPLDGLLKQYNNTPFFKVVINSFQPFMKLENGYLVGCFTYSPSTKTQEDILDFSDWLNEKEISFLTLITPDKSDDSVTVFPEGIPHGYSQMYREYIDFLEKNALIYLDSKPILLSENEDFYSWFYQTDHHWNVRAAFVMANETARVLNDELHIPADTDVLSDENYELTVYPDGFLGSYGRRLGNAWREDLEVYYPTKDTSFRIQIPTEGVDKTGSFEDTLLDQSSLTRENSYCVFLGGDHALIRIENQTCQNGTRVLVIKKSFADVYCPYLACCVQYLDIIDPRYFDGSIRSFIEQTDPDIVLTCFGVVAEEDEGYLDFK